MLSGSVEFATSFFERAIGLFRKRSDGCILVLSPCSSIHTFFMKEHIDIAFVSKDGEVLQSEKQLSPGSFRSCKKAVIVLERFSKTDSQWFEKGDKIYLLRKKDESVV